MSANGGQIVVEFTVDNGKAIVAIKNAGQTLQGFKQTLESTASSVGKLEASQNSFARRARDMVLIAGNLRFALMDVNDIFLKLPMSILKTAGELEQMQALMTGLSKEFTKAGKEAEGLKSFGFVTEMAKRAPFEIKALSDTFVKFKSAGLDPTDGSMQALVDSVARFGGSGDTLKRAGVAIQQMAGKGVISMEELRQQLGEAVPTAMQDMADQMGISMAELAKVVQTGTLKAEPALAKMFLRMQVNAAGAAAEMMGTWVGMTARLKTEWDLMAKTIADSGFATEAKRVVAELTKMLSSPEGRAAGVGFGQSLAGAVTTLVSLSKFLYEHADAIKYTAGAWAAYKVVTGLVMPLSERVSKALSKGSEALSQQGNSVRAAIAAEVARAEAVQAAAAQRISLAQAEARAVQKSTLESMLAKQSEVAGLEQANARILASQNRLQAALKLGSLSTSTLPVQQPNGTFQLQAPQQVRGSMQDNDMAAAANSAQIRKLNQEMKDLEKQNLAAAKAVDVHTTQLNTLTSTANRAGAAALSLAGTIGTGLKAAFFAVGGWVTVAITAISLLIGWMYKLKAASEEAAAAVARAKQDRSTADDVKAATETQIDLEKQLAKAKEQTAAAQTLVSRGGNAQQMRTSQGILERALKAEQDLTARAAQAKGETLRRSDSVARQAAQQDAENASTAVRIATEAQRTADGVKLAEMKASNEKIIKGTKEGTKERNAAVLNAANMEAKFEIASRTTVANASRDAAAKAQAELDGMKGIPSGNPQVEQRRKSLQLSVIKLSGEYEQQTREIEAMQNRLDLVVDTSGKKKADKGGKEKLYTPIEKLIQQLKADKAELEAELAGISSTLGQLDKVGAAGARVRAKAEVGGYDDKDAKGKKRPPSKEKVEEAATLAESVERMEISKKAIGKIVEQSQAFKDDYADAMAVLLDPMKVVQDGSKSGALTDILAKTGMSITELGVAAGMSAEEIKKLEAIYAAAQNMAQTIDMSKKAAELGKLTQDMQMETRKLNAEIIKDDRARMAALAAIEDEEMRLKKERLVNFLKESGKSAQVIADAEAAFQLNVSARAAKLAEDSKTPMQKMSDDWANATKQMDNATASWAQNGVDSIINMAKTGKLEFSSFVTSVLADILRIEMQKNLAGAIGSIKGSTSANAGAGMLGSLGSWIGGLFGFAKGGVMSGSGSMPLKKYAAGGVANSPQLAVFGEGDMNEAYVPLPDGRSIPVTMSMSGQGGAAPAGAMPQVMVNVINQTSTPVNAQQGQPRFDGQQFVLDVVLQGVSQPGAFRDGMKGAMGG